MKQKQLRIAMLGTGIVASLWIINIVSAHEGHKNRNAPASARKLKNPSKVNEKTIAAGQTLYNQHCASCHGEDGRSVTGMAAMMGKKPTDLTAKAMRGITDGEIFWVITYGIKKSGMPSFSPGVSWRDRWYMTLYVRQLMRQPPNLAGGVRKVGQMTGGQMSDHASHQAHLEAVNERGFKVMGFSQERTVHRFRLKPDGGSIEIVVRDPNDATSREQIRAHLKEIEQKFTAGDFTAPTLIHATAPPGLPLIKEQNALIKYQFEEIISGGRIRIITSDQKAISAIHEFLRFQISEHRTGDSGEVEK